MTFTFRDAIDILIVAFVIYRVINAVQGTRVTTLVKGLAIIFGSRVVARALNLQTVSWLLDQATTSVLVALPVVFYPELRRGLEQIGTGRLFARFGARGEEQINVLIHDVVRAAARMSEVKTGALFVFERAISLEEYVQTGVKLDAESSVELFMSIFRPETPLHDGAVILAGGEWLVQAVCCPSLINAWKAVWVPGTGPLSVFRNRLMRLLWLFQRKRVPFL